jgi:serine phosphatase RsbU (regulator of sigma subunit)
MLFHLSELSSEPIHRQIIRQIRAKVLTGSLEEGAVLPPHRTFARRQRVSAISVERAYQVDVVVADVSGKGIGPSLIMASVKAVLPFLTVDRSLPEVLDALNRRLYEELARREFVALAIARLEPPTGRIQVINAGLPDPYRLTPGGPERIEVTGERLPLGIRPRVTYRAAEARLEPGEGLLLVSDGLPEAETTAGEPIGYERFAEILAATAVQRPREDPEEWMESLLLALRRETIPLQRDDWTAVLLERASQPERSP